LRRADAPSDEYYRTTRRVDRDHHHNSIQIIGATDSKQYQKDEAGEKRREPVLFPAEETDVSQRMLL